MENRLTASGDKNWIRIFDVGDPQRHKKGFTVYKVTSKVFPKGDPGGLTVLTVWKRYNDFKKLHVELEKIHRQLYLRGKFPEFPKKDSFHRFEYEVIEERKKAATLLLQFAGNCVQLFTARVFNQFFEEGYNPNDFVHHMSINSNEETKDKELQELPECLAPEIVWEVPEKHDDDVASTTSLGSDGFVSTSSDSIVSGSVFSSVSTCRSPHGVTPSTGIIPKSQSQFLIPTFLSSETSTPINCDEHEELADIKPSASIVDAKTEEAPVTQPVITAPALGKTQTKILSFLPNFANRQKHGGKDSEEKLLSQALTSSYICEAAGHFAVAQDNESKGKFHEAFTSYKEGIRILLEGAKHDDDAKRKQLVKAKLEKYLSLAENAHGRISSSKFKVFNVPQSPVRAPAPSHNLPSESLCPLEHLKEYKFVRVIDGKMFLVMNLHQTTEPRCFILKVLPFSMEPLESDKLLLLPENVPFIAKLYKWFELDSAYIVLVQYAAGGKLIDYINSYQQKPVIEQEELSSTVDEIGHALFNDTVQNKMADLDSGVSSSNEEIPVLGNSEQCSSLDEGCFNDVQKSKKIVNNILKASAQNCKFEHSTSDNSSLKSRNQDLMTCLKGNENTQIIENSEPRILIGKENCEFTPNSSIDDLIESSRGLLAQVSSTLAKQKSQMCLAGEFLSKSLEDICLNAGASSSTSMTSRPQASALAPSILGSQSRQEIDKKNLAPELPTVLLEDEEEPPILRFVPEGCIRGWASEIIICLEKYHALGLVYMDLAMHNILLGENGHILISFKAQWPNIDQWVSPAVINEYSAPEIVQTVGRQFCTKPHPSCDFWSLGALLFELFTGQSVHNVHPEGFHPQTIIQIPETNLLGEKISPDVCSLLKELLEVNPTLRLGFYGAEEIKSHPCFDGFDWDLVCPVHDAADRLN